MSENRRYAAFISYAHMDEQIAARLQKTLEVYSIPKNLTLIRKRRLSPVFRDTTELSAHHSLPDKIREAIRNSEFLIVLCTPSAKASHWVNEEIRLFRKERDDASIICVLTGGSPETSFPPALIEDGREPLAADLGTTRDGFRTGVTQIAATMLGVGLDQLIQRENKRRRRRSQGIVTGSLIFATLMGGMAWTALQARDSAEISRTEAEKMVEFMLSDLKQDLEPLGRLKILNDVGTRVASYYDAIPFEDMDDERLSRRARARHLLGQVALSERKIDKAEIETNAAYNATKEVLRRNPDHTNALFAHAQSAFWKGEVALVSQNYEDTLLYWREYESLATGLYERDPGHLPWVMEAAYSHNNLAAHKLFLGANKDALTKYELAIDLFKKALSISSGDLGIYSELANSLDGASRAAFALNLKKKSKTYYWEQVDIYENLLDHDPLNFLLRFRRAQIMTFYSLSLEPSDAVRMDNFLEIKKEMKVLTDHDPANKNWAMAYQAIKKIIEVQ